MDVLAFFTSYIGCVLDDNLDAAHMFVRICTLLLNLASVSFKCMYINTEV